MSAPPRQLPPPSNPAVPPVLAAVVYLALVVATWGFMSLALDREVIDYADAGPLLGPTMAVSAGLVTFFALRSRSVRVWAAALVAASGSYLAMIAVAGIGYSVTRSDATWMLLSAAHAALSPFVAAAAGLSALVVVAFRLAKRGSAPRDQADGGHPTI